MKSTVSPMEIIRTAGRLFSKLPAIRTLNGSAYKQQFKNFKTLIAATIKVPGGSEALRGAREMAKRPHLVYYLEYLGRSSLYTQEWTPNTFRKFAQWDPTVSKSIVIVLHAH